jgi:hypothetical protein
MNRILDWIKEWFSDNGVEDRLTEIERRLDEMDAVWPEIVEDSDNESN